MRPLLLNHPRRNEIIEIFKRLSVAVKNYQDQKSGVWYQVTDKAEIPGNYLESSGSSMFVYAFAKGARMGYIDKNFEVAARKGFEGLVKNFIGWIFEVNLNLSGGIIIAGHSAKIDAPGDNDEGHADADDAEERRPPDQVLDVVARAETVAGISGEHADRHQQPQDAEDLFHRLFRPPPVPRRSPGA